MATGTAKDVLEAAASSATAAVVAASIFNLIANLALQASLQSLVNALKNMQIIVHIMLIQVYLVAPAELFLKKMQ